MEYSKLLDASKYVVRAKNALLKHENFDTREFTLYIESKKWVHHILAPLLGLCGGNEKEYDGEDLGLAMRCCGLAIVLIKRISDSTMKVLDAAASSKSKRAVKSKVLLPSANTDYNSNSETDEKKLENDAEKVQAVDRANLAAVVRNAKQQGTRHAHHC